MKQDGQGVKLLFEIELDSHSLTSPFFWKQKASPKARSDWIWGFVTTEYDPEQAGSTTVIRMFRGVESPVELPSLRGFEILDGEPLTVGDWNGDGKNELIVIDWDGKQRAYEFGGGPLDGFTPKPSDAKLVAHRPLVRDVNGDGRAELVFLSLDAPLAGGVSMLSISHASGSSLPGLPLELEPPAVSSLAIASAKSRNKKLVFIREDGSVCSYEIESRRLDNIMSVSPEAAPNVSIAAADLNSDGEDEIFIASGEESLECVVIEPESTSRYTVYEREHSAIVAVASGLKRDGSSVLYAYDQVFRQFIFHNGKKVVLIPHITTALEQRLVSLSSIPTLGKAGDIFVATFFEPASARDVESVFEKRATPEMRKVWANNQPQEDANQRRELKRSLLIEDFGEEETEEMLVRPAVTEVCLLDSEGNMVGEAPVRVHGVHPFVEYDVTIVVHPELFHFKSKLYLLVGLYEDRADGAAYVRMYEMPYR